MRFLKIQRFLFKNMKNNNQEMEEELVKEVMKPSKIFKH